MSNKLIIVPWSGGLDSTSLLIKTLKKKKYSNSDIHAVRIELVNNKRKNWCEENASSSIVKILSSKGLREFKYVDSCAEFLIKSNANGWSQPQIWLICLMMHASGYCNTYKDISVLMGYVKGDDMSNNLDYLHQLWNSLLNFHPAFQNKPLLETPLIETSKLKLHKYLMREAPEVLPKIWTCEDPRHTHHLGKTGYEECGTCKPCIRKKEDILDKFPKD